MLHDPAPTETLPGQLSLFGFPHQAAAVTVARHAPAMRARRAALALGACWGLAGLTILIPIAHFVLVPSFFVTGLVLGARRLGEVATVVGVKGLCPRCGVERTFEGGGRLRVESGVTCRECHNTLGLAIDPARVKAA